jgi:hypothetical protein
MTFCLQVFTKNSVNNLKTRWIDSLALHGLNVDFSPSFDPDKRTYQLVEVKVVVASDDSFKHAKWYTCRTLVARLSMEVSPFRGAIDLPMSTVNLIDLESRSRIECATLCYEFCNIGSPSVIDYRIQWYLASTLAELSDGVMYNMDLELSVGIYSSKSAVLQAKRMAEIFEQPRLHKCLDLETFKGWAV